MVTYLRLEISPSVAAGQLRTSAARHPRWRPGLAGRLDRQLPEESLRRVHCLAAVDLDVLLNRLAHHCLRPTGQHPSLVDLAEVRQDVGVHLPSQFLEPSRQSFRARVTVT